MCDCIDKLYEHYDKEFKGGIQFTNTVNLFNRQTGAISTRPPVLRFKRYSLGKNGEPTKKTVSGYIDQNYCQFCGIKY